MSAFLDSKRRRVVAFATLGVAAMALVVWTTRPAPARTQAKLNFTLKDVQGADVTLADFKGRPLVINFWETFCVPCQFETPDLVDVYSTYKDEGLVLVGLSMHDEVADVRKFVDKYKMNYTVLIGGDRDDIANTFAIMGWPTTFFIRKDGTISAVRLGIVKRDEMEEQIKALF